MVDTETVSRDLTDIDDIVRLDVVVLGVHQVFRTRIESLNRRHAVLLTHELDLLSAVELTEVTCHGEGLEDRHLLFVDHVPAALCSDDRERAVDDIHLHGDRRVPRDLLEQRAQLLFEFILHVAGRQALYKDLSDGRKIDVSLFVNQIGVQVIRTAKRSVTHLLTHLRRVSAAGVVHLLHVLVRRINIYVQPVADTQLVVLKTQSVRIRRDIPVRLLHIVHFPRRHT